MLSTLGRIEEFDGSKGEEWPEYVQRLDQGSICIQNYTTEHHWFSTGRTAVGKDPKDKNGSVATQYGSQGGAEAVRTEKEAPFEGKISYVPSGGSRVCKEF